MASGIALAIVLAILLTLLLTRVPVGLALIAAGAAGIMLSLDLSAALATLATRPLTSTASISLIVIPMFILLGAVVGQAGLAESIFSAANRAVRRLPGGLAAATVMATAMFSGISGSSAADVATFGRVAVRQMVRHGYETSYACAVIAASGTFSNLIPPSVAIVIYALLANVSVGSMLLAGLVPGVLSCLALAIFVVIRARFGRGSSATSASQRVGAISGASASTTANPPAEQGMPSPNLEDDRGLHLSGIAYAITLFALVMGGLYTGVFTATEAGAVGAFAAVLMALFATGFRLSKFVKVVALSLSETATATSMIFLLLIGGGVFNYYLGASGVATSIAEWIGGMHASGMVIAALFLLFLLIMGCVLDGMTIMLLTVPLMAPIVASLGLDGVWFGILVLKVVEIGLITPPLGINVFVIAGIIPEARVSEIFRSLVPFVLLDLALTAVFFAFPEVVLWLPRQAGF